MFDKIIKLPVILVFLCISTTSTAQSEQACVNWFKDAYAPLWSDVEILSVKKVAECFAETFQEFTSKGQYTIKDGSVEAWEERIKTYKESGWLGGELLSVSAYAYSPGTALQCNAQKMDKQYDAKKQ